MDREGLIKKGELEKREGGARASPFQGQKSDQKGSTGVQKQGSAIRVKVLLENSTKAKTQLKLAKGQLE